MISSRRMVFMVLHRTLEIYLVYLNIFSFSLELTFESILSLTCSRGVVSWHVSLKLSKFCSALHS